MSEPRDTTDAEREPGSHPFDQPGITKRCWFCGIYRARCVNALCPNTPGGQRRWGKNQAPDTPEPEQLVQKMHEFDHAQHRPNPSPGFDCSVSDTPEVAVHNSTHNPGSVSVTPEAEAAMVATLGEGHKIVPRAPGEGAGWWAGGASIHLGPRHLVALARDLAAAQAEIARLRELARSWADSSDNATAAADDLRAALARCQHQRGLTGDGPETPDLTPSEADAPAQPNERLRRLMQEPPALETPEPVS